MLRILLIALLLCTSLAHAADPPAIAVGEPHPQPGTPDPQLLRYLGINGNAAGRWSADGQQIAFTTAWTGTAQKWVIPGSGGFPRRITYFEDAISFCDFSPHDPNLMWLGYSAGGNERTQLWFVNADGSDLRPLATNPEVIHNPGDWSRDGRWVSYVSNERNPQYFDVYLYDRQTEISRRIFERDANVSAGKFSPNGEWMLASVNHSNVNNDVFLIETDTGRSTLLTFHEEEATFGSFSWADEETLYFTTNVGGEFSGIAKMTIPFTLHAQRGTDFSEAMPPYEYIYRPQRDVESVSVSDDGRWIGWTENEDGFGAAHLARLPYFLGSSGKPGTDELPIPKGIQAIGKFSPDSESVMLQASGPEGPTDLWRYELESGQATRLTYASLGGISTDSYVVPEVKRFITQDGIPLSGLWYAPRGDRPAGGWPVVVMAHGGPEGQARPYFDPKVQLLLSMGAAVFELNPRGSSGYGKTFLTLDNVEKREDSVRDYAEARDFLVQQKLADPARVAITGGSYGGYVVLGALTLYPDKWSAGVCAVGISNFVTFLENTGPYRRAIREAEYGSLATDRAVLERISPIHRVTEIKAPLLLIHGTNDPRVPVGEAQQMHDALKALGREVDLLVFADEGHGVAKLSNRAIEWQRELEFLKRHLKLGGD